MDTITTTIIITIITTITIITITITITITTITNAITTITIITTSGRHLYLVAPCHLVHQQRVLKVLTRQLFLFFGLILSFLLLLI
jgi:cbb3-type cytochrome oxidase cytochrome c subunit